LAEGSMRDFSLQLPRDGRPAYLRLAHALRHAIKGGSLTPGEQLPSTRRLGEQLQLHRNTVMAGLGELVAEGWIESELRRGYRVVATLPSRYFTAAPPTAKPAAKPRRPPPTEGDEEVASTGVDLRSGRADFALFPFAE